MVYWGYISHGYGVLGFCGRRSCQIAKNMICAHELVLTFTSSYDISVTVIAIRHKPLQSSACGKHEMGQNNLPALSTCNQP
ncbi:hypothetical protein FKM82_029597 [Ascaphus truei]